MYQGTMIDELFAIVERAEVLASMVKAERKPEVVLPMRPMYPPFIYEAPFGASMIGAA